MQVWVNFVFNTGIFICTCEISYGRGNRIAKPKRPNRTLTAKRVFYFYFNAVKQKHAGTHAAA